MRGKAKLTLLLGSIYLLPFKCIVSFVTAPLSLRSKFVVNERSVPVIEEYEEKEFTEDADTITDPASLAEKYKTRSILLQHVLQTQSKKYRTLKTRVLLLQDTIRKHGLNRSAVRSSEQMEMALKKQEELNNMLQARYENILAQESQSKERSKYHLQCLKNVTEELEHELTLITKMTVQQTNLQYKDEIFGSSTLENENASLIRNNFTAVFKREGNVDDDIEEWSRQIQLMRNQIQKFHDEREKLFITWSREREQMEFNILQGKIKLKNEIKGKKRLQQHLLNTSSFPTETSSHNKPIFGQSEEPIAHIDAKGHTMGVRRTIQTVWNSVQMQFHRGIDSFFLG